MKKSILLSLILLGAITGIVGFSMATFMDHETQTAKLTAGTLDLEDTEATPTSCVLSFGSNATDDCTFSYKNVGSLPGTVWALILAEPKACTDTTYGAHDGSAFCDASGDLQAGDFTFCGQLGSAASTCPTQAAFTSAVGSCAIVDSSLGAGETITGDYDFTSGSLINIQQGDGLLVTWHLFLTESNSSTEPTECTALEPVAGPPGI